MTHPKGQAAALDWYDIGLEYALRDALADPAGEWFAADIAKAFAAGARAAFAEQGAGGWIPVTERLPESGRAVLACYQNRAGQWRRICAEWIQARTQECSVEADIGQEYDEEADCYWTPEGWYERIDNWDEYTSVAVTESEPSHWMPLPAPPTAPEAQAGARSDDKGEGL